MVLFRWLVFLICLVAVAPLKAEKLSYLTREERDWLQAHRNTIRIAQDPLYPPVNYVDKQGKFKGVSVDILQILERNLNIKFVNIPTDNLTESFKSGAYRRGGCCMLYYENTTTIALFEFYSPILPISYCYFGKRTRVGKINY